MLDGFSKPDSLMSWDEIKTSLCAHVNLTFERRFTMGSLDITDTFTNWLRQYIKEEEVALWV